MNKEAKCKRFFVTILGFGLVFALLSMSTGCSGSCFGCSMACESYEDLSVSGIKNHSEGCLNSQKSCISVTGCGKFEESSKNKDFIVSCYKSEYGGCGGADTCYKGCYTSGCTSCAIFSGSSDDGERIEKSWGCVEGSFSCGGSTDGSFINALIGMFGILGF